MIQVFFTGDMMYPPVLPSLFTAPHRYGQTQNTAPRSEHCCVQGPTPTSPVSPYYHPDSPPISQPYQSKILSNAQSPTNRYAPYITPYGRISDYVSPTQYAWGMYRGNYDEYDQLREIHGLVCTWFASNVHRNFQMPSLARLVRTSHEENESSYDKRTAFEKILNNNKFRKDTV